MSGLTVSSPTTWGENSVAEIASTQPRAIAIGPFGSRMKAETYVSRGIPVVRGNNLMHSRAPSGSFVYVSEETAQSLPAAVLRPGDLVFPHRGAIGQVGLIEGGPEARLILSTSLMKLTPDRARIDGLFLYYFFRSDLGRGQLMMRASTVGTPGIGQPLESLRSVRVPVPPLDEQRGIAAILGALDDKIESNELVISLTERLADAVFARSAEVVQALGEIGTLTMGSSPPGESYNQAGMGLPFYQGVRDFGRRSPALRIWTSAPARRAEEGDSLISVRAPVGRLNRATETCCIGRGLAALSSPWPSCAYYALRAADEIWLPYQGEGTVFGAINRGDLAGCGLRWPSDTQAQDDLEAELAPLEAKVASLVRESGRLKGLRDVLLPELLSGRLRVPEAREAVADAVK